MGTIETKHTRGTKMNTLNKALISDLKASRDRAWYTRAAMWYLLATLGVVAGVQLGWEEYSLMAIPLCLLGWLIHKPMGDRAISKIEANLNELEIIGVPEHLRVAYVAMCTRFGKAYSVPQFLNILSQV